MFLFVYFSSLDWGHWCDLDKYKKNQVFTKWNDLFLLEHIILFILK